MYQKHMKGWMQHLDFMALDLLALLIAFFFSYFFRHGGKNPFVVPLYRNMAVFLLSADIILMLLTAPFENILKRNRFTEFPAMVRHGLMVFLLGMLYLFTIQGGEEYSRLTMYLMGGMYLLLGYAFRLLRRNYLRHREGKTAMLVLTCASQAEKLVKTLRQNNYGLYRLAGVVLLDQEEAEGEYAGVPVVASAKNAAAYSQKAWVDEVFVHAPEELNPLWEPLVQDWLEMGVTVHLNLERLVEEPSRKQMVEKVGGYTTLTTSMNNATPLQAFLKRAMDIAGGLVGCLVTGLLVIVVGPLIYLNSPGPIFFAQERIGLNGKRFKMYKFRSMYLDAEERKKELMSQNKLGSDLMFKLDFDPRIIGNRIAPDGTKKTGIGQFIRSTSIDEFPQFFNVLKGDMSLVGTRPPLISEFDAYEQHHRARMSVKPGITGMWQVSGRSEITDFEEVVRLDTQYINNWSLWLDIKILFKTVGAVLKKEGSM